MDRDVWMKEMMHFKNFYGVNNLNTQALFYDGHVRNFYDREIHIISSNHIKPFILREGDSGNEQPNYNRPNLNIKGLYDQAIMNWQKKYETLKFTSAHMNDILVETWRAFQLSSSLITFKAFNKTKFLPLTHPDEYTNTQSDLAAAQTPKGKTRRKLK